MAALYSDPYMASRNASFAPAILSLPAAPPFERKANERTVEEQDFTAASPVDFPPPS